MTLSWHSFRRNMSTLPWHSRVHLALPPFRFQLSRTRFLQVISWCEFWMQSTFFILPEDFVDTSIAYYSFILGLSNMNKATGTFPAWTHRIYQLPVMSNLWFELKSLWIESWFHSLTLWKSVADMMVPPYENARWKWYSFRGRTTNRPGSKNVSLSTIST
jgi:hypothetical protein